MRRLLLLPAVALALAACVDATPPPPVPSRPFLVATVPVGIWPVGVAITPDGAFAYVTNFSSGTVSVIETASNTVIATATATVGVDTLPFGVAITPDGAFAYVTHEGSGTVSVIATASNTVVATVPVGLNPSGVAITPFP